MDDALAFALDLCQALIAANSASLYPAAFVTTSPGIPTGSLANFLARSRASGARYPTCSYSWIPRTWTKIRSEPPLALLCCRSRPLALLPPRALLAVASDVRAVLSASRPLALLPLPPRAVVAVASDARRQFSRLRDLSVS